MPSLREEAFVEILIDAAKRHGELSEPDHEVGDLQVLLRAAWRSMTPEQRSRTALDSHELLAEWGD